MTDSVDTTAAPGRNQRRLRFELIFGSAWLGVGLFLMPALIFMVGVTLLGPYREGSGLGRFYVDFFGDLAEPSGRAWLIALGPLLLISLLRAVFIGTRKGPGEPNSEDDASHQPPPRKKSDHSRVEPRVGLD